MNKAQSLTDALHLKSDEALKKHINTFLFPLFEEAKSEDYSSLRRANPDEWKAFDDPWIGSAMTRYRDLAFLYLRDKWRAKAVHDFICKVEAVDDLRQEIESIQTP